MAARRAAARRGRAATGPSGTCSMRFDLGPESRYLGVLTLGAS